MTDAQKSQIEGECKFIRGVMIFEMLRIWGHQYGHKTDNSQPGVIIRTAPTRGTAGLAIGRSTVEDCYTQVISDLKASENLLSDAKRDGYATKSAAQAYLARVYFKRMILLMHMLMQISSKKAENSVWLLHLARSSLKAAIQNPFSKWH